MKTKKIRWGILSTAQIARKNWKAIQLAGNSTVAAVASRDLARSRRFIEECQADAPNESVPRAFGSHEELLNWDEVDAVYIPMPTGVRTQWAFRAAQAGKHIICEKPCTPAVAELQQVLDACQRANVRFMDDVMFVHSARFDRLREVLNDGQSIGQTRRMTAHFSFRGSPEFFASNIRVHSDLEPLGCLGDLGWYCIRFFLWAMNWRMPLQVSGRLLSVGKTPGSPADVPTEFSGELLFESGVSAGFYCSFITQIEQWAIVSGNGGLLLVEDFVLPFAGNESSFEVRKSDYRINGCDFRMDTDNRRITVPEWSHGHANAQEANCFRNFADQILSGQPNKIWPEAAFKTQVITCACLESARAGGRSISIQ